jgi:phosphohistidine phosphatase
VSVTSEHRLILLRHAKSSWGDLSLPDEERPLAPRGERAVELLRAHLRGRGVGVDLVLCSPARRTRETWAGIRAGLPSTPEVRFVPDVYEATANGLLHLLREVDRDVGTVLLIGHNPGMAQLAERLVGGGDATALDRLEQGFPTGGLATLSLPVEWADLAPSAARLEEYVRPRDLG